MSQVLTFAGDYIDRCALLRTRADELRAVFEHPETAFLPVWRNQCLVATDAVAFCDRPALGALALDYREAIFLGRFGGRHVFAVGLPASLDPPAAVTTGSGSFAGLRDVLGRLPAADSALLALARAMVLWHERHRYCGHCGAPNAAIDGGFVLECTRPECAERTFPRLDPAIIVLAHRGDRCLLGRQAAWPPGRFSTIAGFVEPGESLEDAVRREVREETDVAIGRCQYVASQPWPFPSSLMIGFHAEAVTEAIQLNDAELAEACWLSRAELAAGVVKLPPPESIAWRLIESWFDAGPGPRLREVGQVGSFNAPPGRR